jgi:hypothetical protein
VVKRRGHLFTLSDDDSGKCEISLVESDRCVGHQVAGQPGPLREFGSQLTEFGVEPGPHDHDLLHPIHRAKSPPAQSN